ncbi:MAG: hypothetical protein HY866_04230 [Chloroflexi bacterium]|nr:hypothetical protein [Chloroflexota bacterium]
MSIVFVRGDIFLTQAQTIILGLSANGQLNIDPLITALQDRCPVFVSDYQRRCRKGILSPGAFWVWRESKPWIAALIVRETPQGATRPRHIETALLNLYKSAPYESLTSLALMRLGDDLEWASARAMVEYYLKQIGLPAVVYEEYLAGIAAEAPDS